jgi:hypothetical protein
MQIKIRLFALLMLAMSCAATQAAQWAYDPEFKPISPQEITRLIGNPNLPGIVRDQMLSRAAVYGLLENVVVESSNQLKKRPNDPVLRSLYCYALFLANDPSVYKPQNRTEWLRQQKELSIRANRTAEYLIMNEGATVPFCWRTLAYLNLMGIADGVAKGVERAEKAVQLNPKDLYSHRLLAYAYLKSGPTQNLSKALFHARRATVLQPKSQGAYRHQASAYFLGKQYSSAYSALKKAESLLPPPFRDGKQLRHYEMWAKQSSTTPRWR